MSKRRGNGEKWVKRLGRRITKYRNQRKAALEAAQKDRVPPAPRFGSHQQASATPYVKRYEKCRVKLDEPQIRPQIDTSASS